MDTKNKILEYIRLNDLAVRGKATRVDYERHDRIEAELYKQFKTYKAIATEVAEIRKQLRAENELRRNEN